MNCFNYLKYFIGENLAYLYCRWRYPTIKRSRLYPLNRFELATCLCLSQARVWITIISCRGIFVFNDLGCSFKWYCRNYWPSLLKLSVHNFDFFSLLIGFTVCLCSTLTFLVSRQDLVHIRKCKLRRKRHLKQNHKFKSFNLSIMVEKHHWMKTGRTKCFLFCHLLILCASIVFFVYVYLLLK